MSLKQFFIFGIIIFIFSCNTEPTDAPYEETNDSTLLKRIIYDKDTADEYSETFNYNGNKLISVDYGDGSKNVYTYENDNLIKDEYFSEGILMHYASLEYDSNGKLITFTENWLENAGWDNRIAKHELSINSDNTITDEVYQSFNGAELEFYQTRLIKFDDYTNIKEYGNNEYYSSYTYDNKNGMFKNVHAIEVLNLLSEIEFGASIYGNKNNVTSFKENGDDIVNEYYDTYEYTYNENNYPISSTCISQRIDGSDQDIETIEYFYE